MTEFITASDKDLKTIEGIARKTWPNTFGKVMSKKQIDYMLDTIYNKTALNQQMISGHIFLLINYNNQSIGYTSYELNYKNKPHLMIHKVYLLPISQGLGIGKETFEHLTHIANENNQNTLTLKVFVKNEKAIGFYEKKGFGSIGTEATDIGMNYTIVDNVMAKKIT